MSSSVTPTRVITATVIVTVITSTIVPRGGISPPHFFWTFSIFLCVNNGDLSTHEHRTIKLILGFMSVALVIKLHKAKTARLLCIVVSRKIDVSYRPISFKGAAYIFRPDVTR